MADLDDEALDSPAELTANTEQKEWESFKRKLAEFPNSFHLLADSQQPDSQYLEKQSRSLKSALSVGYQTGMETARANNFLSFVLFCQGQPSEALTKIEEALSVEGEGDNLVSLANKAAILWHTERLHEAEEVVKRLQELKTDAEEFDYLKVKAKAELAFSYTRMRPRFYPKAVPLFEEVLVQAREPEKWLWTLGLGLTKRRLLHLQHAPMLKTNVREEVLDTLRLLRSVLDKSASKSLRAKACAEIAVLVDYSEVDQQLQAHLVKEVKMDATEACERALELDADDNAVLCKTGQIFQFAGKLERSAKLLKKALSIRPSSTAYHHLGRVYKALAVKKQNLAGDTPSPAAQTELLKRTMNIPSDVKLKRNDPYVTEAMEYFQEAVKFSEGTNLQAKYDLALMHRHVGELDKALDLLTEIRNSNWERLNYISVNSFEQSGLILKEKSKSEADEEKKRQLSLQAESMLYKALTKAVQLYSRTPHLQGQIGDVWYSFSELLKEVDGSNISENQKLGKKAKLFQLISDHEQSMALLEEIRKMAPEEAKNPKHLKLCIENYVAVKEFGKALTFIELLKCTERGRDTLVKLGGQQYVLKVYLQAAKRALLDSSLADSKEHFHTAFMETVEEAQSDASTGSDTDSGEGDQETWDIMMIYDGNHGEDSQSERQADALAGVLKNACGLKVTLMDQDVQLGRPILDGMVHIMRRSRLVVILAGQKRISTEMRSVIDHAARRQGPRTVTLLTDGDHVPRNLAAHPWMPCPAELLSLATEQGSDEMTAETAQGEVTTEHEEAGTQEVRVGTEQMRVGKERAGIHADQESAGTEQTGVGTEQMRAGKERAGIHADQEGARTDQKGVGTEHAGDGKETVGVTTEQAELYSKETIRAICKVFSFLVGVPGERPKN
ncbi:hypothetical protein BaRGS_00009988 [Batillaria attramentaria]|uniref:Uncharacterized protein n=1 Tax=Batillaria attramentaria TaxID=370345 RepID=A0ABD0LHC8_9CAEN